MTFGREKRLLLGWMALMAPLPLPFNTVLEWPVLFLYTVLVLYFLQRSESGADRWLPNWALNVLGGIYMPLFLIDVRLAVMRGSPVKALIHLLLFLVVVKLFSIRREREKWHLVIAIFFVFVGAMATSSHVTISIYLLAFMVLSLYVLGRFSHLHVLTSLGEDEGRVGSRKEAPSAIRLGQQRAPVRRPLLAGTLLIVMVAVPLFATMPRVREPYIMGRGGLGIGRTTGFSDSVDLGVTSRIRGNRNIAMRVQYDEPRADGSSLRFRGATFEYYRNRRWFRELRSTRNLVARADGFQEVLVDPVVPPDEPETAVVFLEPLGGNNALVVPSTTRAVRLGPVAVVADAGGALMHSTFGRRDTLRFEVEMNPEPVVAGFLGKDGRLTALQVGEEVTPEVRQLAQDLMGEGSEEERVDRLLNALLTQYLYTDDLTSRDGQEPLQDFLFTYKSGHCELFATSMVLMLRSQGIPARYVNGFLGAELNPIEDYFVVRQQNAHAWVEAYTPQRGWQVYDPTPPEGRPGVSPQSWGLFFQQVADFIMFRWDRYILTYGADDQKSLFRRLQEAFTEWWSRFKEEEAQRDELMAIAEGVEISGDALPAEEAIWRPKAYQIFLFAVALTGAVVWIARRRRQGRTASQVYLRLRHLLARVHDEVDDTIVPLRLQELAVARYPAVAADVQHLMRLYLQESFAERPLQAEETARLGDLLQRLEKAERLKRQEERRLARRRKQENPAESAAAVT